MWQALIVAVLVLASAGYAAWALAPARSRPRLAAWAARWLRRGPGPLSALADRIERAAVRAAGSAGSACGACPQSRITDTSRKTSPSRR